MHISAIYRLMGGDGAELYTGLRELSRQQRTSLAIRQYNQKLHRVTDPLARPDKIIFVPNGQKDPVTGKDILVMDTSPVTRIPVGFEKYIISQKATFAAGSGVLLKPSIPDTELFDHVSRNWYDNKLDYWLIEIFRRVMAYTEAAVIFYGDRGAESFEDWRYKMKILSAEDGDVLEPFFDEDDDLVAFGREYEVDGNTRYDFYVIGESGFVEIRRFENGALLLAFDGEVEGEPSAVFVTTYTKLPIVYWSQRLPECDITAEMREEFEEAFNQFCTQMGYSAESILFGRGETMSMPAKGVAGKYMEGVGENADLKYVSDTAQHEPREFQFKVMQKFIFGLNRAVFLDFETMKTLGGDISGVAMKRYLMDAYMEATNKQKGYLGLGVQRMVNWLLHTWRELAGGDSRLRIYTEFQQYSLESEDDRINRAMKANGGLPVVTHQTSIDMAALEEDSETALATIQSQQQGNGNNNEQ